MGKDFPESSSNGRHLQWWVALLSMIHINLQQKYTSGIFFRFGKSCLLVYRTSVRRNDVAIIFNCTPKKNKLTYVACYFCLIRYTYSSTFTLPLLLQSLFPQCCWALANSNRTSWQKRRRQPFNFTIHWTNCYSHNAPAVFIFEPDNYRACN